MTEQDLRKLFKPQLDAGLIVLNYWINKDPDSPFPQIPDLHRHDTSTQTFSDLLATLEGYDFIPNTFGRPTFFKE